MWHALLARDVNAGGTGKLRLSMVVVLSMRLD